MLPDVAVVSSATLRRLELAAGKLAADCLAAMELQHPGFARLPAEQRAGVLLVAQTGVANFVAWLGARGESIRLTAEAFRIAPRDLAERLSLRQTVDLVRIATDVFERHLPQLAADETERRVVVEGILRFGREIAFAAAAVYAGAAETRGAWDARQEALVVDAVVRGETDDALVSRASALGWDAAAAVRVVVGSPAPDPRSALRGKARAPVLVGVQGSRLIVLLAEPTAGDRSTGSRSPGSRLPGSRPPGSRPPGSRSPGSPSPGSLAGSLTTGPLSPGSVSIGSVSIGSVSTGSGSTGSGSIGALTAGPLPSRSGGSPSAGHPSAGPDLAGLLSAGRPAGARPPGARPSGSRSVTSAPDVPAWLADGFGPGPVVVGPRAPDLAGAHASATEALSGLRAAPGWPGAPRPVAADDLLPERALSGDATARARLIETVVTPLREAGGDLAHTLEVYLEGGGALEACARVLFVHPNTVRYRLRRVSELTDRHPADPRDALVLRAAVIVGRLAE